MIVDSTVIDILQGKSVDVTAIFYNAKFAVSGKQLFRMNESFYLLQQTL